MATWRQLIQKEVLRRGDAFPSACTLSAPELDVEFNNDYGGHQGEPFTAWSPDRVYFPVVYDGKAWVGSVPRSPCGEATEHQGGE